MKTAIVTGASTGIGRAMAIRMVNAGYHVFLLARSQDKLKYYASKRALEDLTIGLAQELEERNIQVNAVSPSDTATESYPKYFPVMKSGTEPFEGFHY